MGFGHPNARFESTNPENNKPWSSFPDATVNDVNNAVAAAKNAFKSWSLSDVKIRAQYLRAIGDQLKNNAEHIGKIETIDSGKLLKETKFQAEYMKDYFYGTIYDSGSENEKGVYDLMKIVITNNSDLVEPLHVMLQL